MEVHAHDHHSGSSSDSARADATKTLWIALAISASFVVIEIVGGLLTGSLALLADAAHLFTDVFALGIAIVARRLSSRPASARHSFGWKRIEILAGQLNAVLLLGVSTWITIAALERLGSDDADVASTGLIVVAAAGLLANLVSTRILHQHGTDDVNVRAAALHTAGDAAGSAGALLAGVSIALGVGAWIDAGMSLLISALVIVAAGRLLLDTTHVLLEGTPRHIDPHEVEAALRAADGVVAVHHLHLWTLSPGVVALSAHVELAGLLSLHEAQAHGDAMKTLLRHRFAIDHSTLELECHPCPPELDPGV